MADELNAQDAAWRNLFAEAADIAQDPVRVAAFATPLVDNARALFARHGIDSSTLDDTQIDRRSRKLTDDLGLPLYAKKVILGALVASTSVPIVAPPEHQPVYLTELAPQPW